MKCRIWVVSSFSCRYLWRPTRCFLVPHMPPRFSHKGRHLVIMEEDGYVLIPKSTETQLPFCLSDIDQFIESLQPSVWTLNVFLHQNPELGFSEHKAHDALTSFMHSQNGWKVTQSLHGMDTAWMSVYDSKMPGPAVSFNVEMGTLQPLKCRGRVLSLIERDMIRCPAWARTCVWPQPHRRHVCSCSSGNGRDDADSSHWW